MPPIIPQSGPMSSSQRAAAARYAASQRVAPGGLVYPQYGTARGGWNNPVVNSMRPVSRPAAVQPIDYPFSVSMPAPATVATRGLGRANPAYAGGPINRLIGPAAAAQNRRAIAAASPAAQFNRNLAAQQRAATIARAQQNAALAKSRLV